MAPHIHIDISNGVVMLVLFRQTYCLGFMSVVFLSLVKKNTVSYKNPSLLDFKIFLALIPAISQDLGLYSLFGDVSVGVEHCMVKCSLQFY